MTEEQLANARSVLDSSPGVVLNDYGEYEPRIIMDNVYARSMEDTSGMSFDSVEEAMASAALAVTAFKQRAEAFIEEHTGISEADE